MWLFVEEKSSVVVISGAVFAVASTTTPTVTSDVKLTVTN